MSDSSPSETQSKADKEVHPSKRCIVIIVMGVSGTGKTTLATALSKEWNMEFVEGDGLHSDSNIEKMASGRALDDQDREPWLESIRNIIMEQRTVQRPGPEVSGFEQGLIITCSALKKSYREILRGRLGTQNLKPPPWPASELATYFVYIKGRKEIILQRLQEREGHYMKADMLDSQFDDLESPEGEEGVVVVDAEDDTRSQMDRTKEGIMALAGESFLKCL